MGTSAGRVLLIPKGDWNAQTTYTGLDWVRHNGAAWVCKNTCTGIEPTEANADNWQMMSRDGTEITVDAEISDQSTNPVQNKVIKKYVDDKQVNIDGVTLTLDEAKNVIKLADTLKDKIGTALQPESIVNNQITTEEGFALDARQANPNIDGTLAKQLSDLNGSLNKADENTISNWMVGYSILGEGFAVQIPSINNYNFSSKKIKIFTTSGWKYCTSQPDFVTQFGSGYIVFYRDGLPEGLEYGKAFLCQFI